MNSKKLLSLLLVLSVVLAGLLPSTAVYASESGTSTVVLNTSGLNFEATVPYAVFIHVDEQGEVTITPDDLQVINHTAAPIKIQSLTVTTKNDWTLDPIYTNYKGFKFNRKHFWLGINGQDPSNGPLSFATPIQGYGSFDLVLSTDVPPQLSVIDGLNICEIAIILDWDAVEDVQEPVIPPDTEDFTVGDVYHEYVDDYGDFVYIPLLTGGAGDYRVIITYKDSDPETQALVNELVYKESDEESCTPGVPLPGYNPELSYEVYITYVDGDEPETIVKVLLAAYGSETGDDDSGSGDDDSGSGDDDSGSGEYVHTGIIPEGYTLATDADFSGEADGEFVYIGSHEYVVIPHVIKGVPVTSYFSMFAYTGVKGVASDNPNITDMSYMFDSSTSETLDLTYLDTSSVTNMRGMFASSQATTLDLSNFDTSKVTNMRIMFNGAEATTIDVSNFDTSNVTDMNNMFASSQATTLDLSNFDTSKVTNMSYMFNGAEATTIDVSNFDTSSVTDMSGMFAGAKATTLDLSNFDTSKVTDMGNMFNGAEATTLDLSNFDTSSVTDMSFMFARSKATTIDISSFNLADTQPNVFYMFGYIQATTVYVRSQADIDYIIANHGTDLPETLNFVIK